MLSRIPLRWMIRECCSIMFDEERLKEIGLVNPKELWSGKCPSPLPVTSSIHLQSPSSHWWSRLRSLVWWLLFRRKPQTGNLTRTDADGLHMHGKFGELTQGTEEEEELEDMTTPIYDQLCANWAWWILEIIPMFHRFQRSSNKWGWWFGWNLGAERCIPREGSNRINIHRSVKMRMDARFANGEKYEPRASFRMSDVNWVD